MAEEQNTQQEQSQDSTSRDTDIIQLYAVEKKPLPEIAAKYGITRQRVDQIVKAAGIPARPRINSREEFAKEYGDQITELFTTQRDVAGVAGTLELTESKVRQFLSDEGLLKLAVHGRKKQRQVQYGDAEVFESLRKANVETPGDTLSADAYDDWREKHGGNTISSVRIIQRFDGWREALELAGVQSNEPLREYTPTYTERDCIEAVKRFVEECIANDGRMVARAYDKWSQENSGMPSLGTVRKTLNGWAAARDRARAELNSTTSAI